MTGASPPALGDFLRHAASVAWASPTHGFLVDGAGDGMSGSDSARDFGPDIRAGPDPTGVSRRVAAEHHPAGVPDYLSGAHGRDVPA